MKKLSNDIAKKIRIAHKQGITSRQLAEKYDVNRTTIMEVIYNRIYKEKR